MKVWHKDAIFVSHNEAYRKVGIAGKEKWFSLKDEFSPEQAKSILIDRIREKFPNIPLIDLNGEFTIEKHPSISSAYIVYQIITTENIQFRVYHNFQECDFQQEPNLYCCCGHPDTIRRELARKFPDATFTVLNEQEKQVETTNKVTPAKIIDLIKGDKYVIQCQNKEIYDKLMKYLEKEGCTWANGDLLNKKNYWSPGNCFIRKEKSISWTNSMNTAGKAIIQAEDYLSLVSSPARRFIVLEKNGMWYGQEEGTDNFVTYNGIEKIDKPNQFNGFYGAWKDKQEILECLKECYPNHIIVDASFPVAVKLYIETIETIKGTRECYKIEDGKKFYLTIDEDWVDYPFGKEGRWDKKERSILENVIKRQFPDAEVIYVPPASPAVSSAKQVFTLKKNGSLYTCTTEVGGLLFFLTSLRSLAYHEYFFDKPQYALDALKGFPNYELKDETPKLTFKDVKIGQKFKLKTGVVYLKTIFKFSANCLNLESFEPGFCYDSDKIEEIVEEVKLK